MFEKTWIGVTGQRWKVYVMFVLLTVGITSLAVAIFTTDQSKISLKFWAIIIFWGVTPLFFLWMFLAIRCPFCGCRVIWTVLRTLPHQESINVALFFLAHCPKCKRSFFERPSLAKDHEPTM